MPLTAIQVKTAKPREKAYKLTDELELYLLVQPNGSKYWRANVVFCNRPRIVVQHFFTLSISFYYFY